MRQREGAPLLLWLEIRGLEQLGAAVEIGRDELRERLRGLLRRLDAERGKTSLGGQLLDRFIDPTVDRAGEVGRQARRSHMPHQAPKLSAGRPTSAIVGISGASELRFVLVTAIARTLPARTIGSSARIASIIIGTWPPATSFTAGAVPR